MPVIDDKTCFIISQIGAANSSERAHADDFLNFIVKACPEIDEFGYNVVRADGIAEPGRITTQVIQHVVESGLVIADLTGLNANVFYELAVRHVSKKPLILCVAVGTILPFDTRDYRTIHYSLQVREAAAARADLGRQIRSIRESGYSPDDPIGEAMQALTLQSSPVTQDQILGQILQAVIRSESRIERLEQAEKLARRASALMQNASAPGFVLSAQSMVVPSPEQSANLLSFQNDIKYLIEMEKRMGLAQAPTKEGPKSPVLQEPS